MVTLILEDIFPEYEPDLDEETIDAIEDLRLSHYELEDLEILIDIE